MNDSLNKASLRTRKDVAIIHGMKAARKQFRTMAKSQGRENRKRERNLLVNVCYTGDLACKFHNGEGYLTRHHIDAPIYKKKVVKKRKVKAPPKTPTPEPPAKPARAPSPQPVLPPPPHRVAKPVEKPKKEYNCDLTGMLDLSYMQSRHMNELSQAKFETLKTLLNFN